MNLLIFLGFIFYYIFSLIAGAISMPTDSNFFFGMAILVFPVWLYVSFKIINRSKRTGKYKKSAWVGPILFVVAAVMAILGS